jgi:dsDNA-specific endonuclease/ATPase MutS2
MNDFIKQPIDGNLDLHTFQPGEIKDLVPEYLKECRHRGILQVRIIHGKGTGVLRTMVLSILKNLPYIDSIRTAGEDAGGWGATIVTMSKQKK